MRFVLLSVLNPYICEECDVSCATLNNLVRHVKNAHFMISEGANFFAEGEDKYVKHDKFKKKKRPG